MDNVILQLDRGIVNTYMEVTWGGTVKRTKTAYHTYKPIFNDTLYFPIIINEDDRNDE